MLNDGSIPVTVNSPEKNDLALESPVSAFSKLLNSGATPAANASDTNPPERIEILPQFRNLPPEQGVIRTLQSIKDSLRAENDALKQALEKTGKYAKFAEDLTEDKELQKSFAATYFPELFQEKTVEQKVEEALKKEFPDFTPVPEDENKRGSKTYRYYKKQDALYDQFENDKSSKVPTLEELATERANKKKAQSDSYKAKVEKLKKDKKLSESDITMLHKFIGTLELEHFWDILQFQLQFGNSGTRPNLSNIPNANLPSSFENVAGKEKFMQVEDYVTSILGPARPKR